MTQLLSTQTVTLVAVEQLTRILIGLSIDIQPMKNNSAYHARLTVLVNTLPRLVTRVCMLYK